MEVEPIDSVEEGESTWNGPYVTIGIGFVGGCEDAPVHVELARRLQELNNRDGMNPHALVGDLDDHDGSHKAVELLERRLREAGTSIERLRWWSFDYDLDPHQPGLAIVSMHGLTQLIGTDAWVAAQRVWPPPQQDVFP